MEIEINRNTYLHLTSVVVDKEGKVVLSIQFHKLMTTQPVLRNSNSWWVVLYLLWCVARVSDQFRRVLSMTRIKLAYPAICKNGSPQLQGRFSVDRNNFLQYNPTSKLCIILDCIPVAFNHYIGALCQSELLR